MVDKHPAAENPLSSLTRFFFGILAPERSYYALAIVYGLGISLLSLATPVSVQMLINTVANIGLTTPLVVLSLTLFFLLLLAGGLNALRIYIMDVFGRRFYARMVSEIALRTIYARNPYFDDRGKSALFNRYFDIIIIMKMLPNLLVGGFTIVLQTVVGFLLVSSYHPVLLAFNAGIAFLIWLVWTIWGRRGIRSAVELSHRKHHSASWLESLGHANGFYKSEMHISEALRRTDEVTGSYMEQHRRHFRHHFSQTLSFLFIYAAASAALLGLGGWLVIIGELSLGQLVAAELVLSVVFLGISQMGIYLSYLYDVCGAVDELSLFFQVEQDMPTDAHKRIEGDSSLSFSKVVVGPTITLDFKIPARSRVCVYADSHRAQRVFTNLVRGHEAPDSGYIAVGGMDLRELKAYEKRQEIIMLDRPNAVETSIREYLRLSAPNAESVDVMEVLEIVGLAETVTQLSQGLDTELVGTGWPLSIVETMQLKLAAAIISKPRILVLTQAYDGMPEVFLLRAMDALQKNCETTIVYFTYENIDLRFDHYLQLGYEQQVMVSDYQSLCELMGLEEHPLRNPLSIYGENAAELNEER
ncbi:ABC transporter ATP-binding protein [Congregibacter variabilis]|uniref:ABC transporter ATP-binding protein n=1 Tax=Congregibacter variabilis TaxID=3081200 RepID=A0ABZ0I6L2_9GAMM|nr:ABC transporter ATP-binding protein [Congregibacter sp. IMCC43200]